MARTAAGVALLGLGVLQLGATGQVLQRDEINEAVRLAMDVELPNAGYETFRGKLFWQQDHIADQDGYYGQVKMGEDGWGTADALCDYWKQNAAFFKTTCNYTFPLAQSEAIVSFIKTPPPAEYFGVQSLVFLRNVSEIPMSGIADAHNHLNLRLDPSAESRFGQPFVMITTGDQNTLAYVKDSLAKTGVPEYLINEDLIDVVHMTYPYDPTTYKFTSYPWDLYQILARLNGVPEDDALKAYLAEGRPVWKVTAPQDKAFAAVAYPGRKTRGTGGKDTELHLQKSMRKLGAAVEKALAVESAASHVNADVPLEFTVTDDEKCLTDPTYTPVFNANPFMNTTAMGSCDRFTNDALYTLSPNGKAFGNFLFERERGFVWYGVNNNATGKATFVNFMVTEGASDGSRRNFEAPDHSPFISANDMVGSARAWAQGAIADADADQLFAWRFARECPPGHPWSQYCTVVDLEMINPTSYAYFIGRSYLETATATGAAPEECLVSHVLCYEQPHRRVGGGGQAAAAPS
uniref:Amine oxidase n=2 Tax=Phaeomonas parva TaxID=124430 RepID=A0A7S1XNZ2_9STRA|mmetsp:Transcript_20362/g.61841  ORF Transcript_20362/g.61841 Transcript_20362/m.61841 type:complete len:521 (+) Transcript_20362:316-1878(+)